MNSRSKIEQSFDGQPPYDASEFQKVGAAWRINFLHNMQEQLIKAALPRKRVFWFHFNKPAPRKAKDARWSVHYKNVCHIVKHINVLVPTCTHYRKSQSICVMRGMCDAVLI